MFIFDNLCMLWYGFALLAKNVGSGTDVLSVPHRGIMAARHGEPCCDSLESDAAIAMRAMKRLWA
jgi:hypothetical protein